MTSAEARALAVTLAAAAAGGALFSHFALPLPWVLGAIFGVIVASRAPRLPLSRPPRWVLNPARAVLGLAIGSAFLPGMLDQLGHYLTSLLFLIPFIAATSLFGALYFHKVLRFDSATAFLCALPGGIAELLIIGDEVGADVRKVALIQGVRILVLVYALPFLAGFLTDADVGARSQIMSNLADISLENLALMALLAAGGWITLKWIGLNGAPIVGPMIFAGAATVFGLLDQRPPDGLFKTAQLVLGASVGSIFIGYSLRRMAETIVTSVGYLLILFCITFATAYVVFSLTDFSLMSALLAFAPGGQAETSVIALILGEDTGYVALHHLFRLILIVTVFPIVVRAVLKRRHTAADERPM